MTPSALNFALASANALFVLTSLGCMLAGHGAIRSSDWRAHRRWMLWAFALQALFLVGFVYRFVVFGFTEFSGQGLARWIYLAIFFAHEPMAVITIPLVVAAVVLGLTGQIGSHRQIVAWAYPIWLFVSVTGLLLYALLYLWST